MLTWTRRQAGVLECSKVFCHAAGQIFALAILVLWVTSALADPLTLRVVEASPGHAPGPAIIVRLDDDGRKAFAQFTTEHVGEVVEVLLAGRVLMAARLNEPMIGGIIAIVVRADDIVEVANRIATEGRIEVNAIGWPRR
jgi:SecDF, P1 head subdomain